MWGYGQNRFTAIKRLIRRFRHFNYKFRSHFSLRCRSSIGWSRNSWRSSWSICTWPSNRLNWWNDIFVVSFKQNLYGSVPSPKRKEGGSIPGRKWFRFLPGRRNKSVSYFGRYGNEKFHPFGSLNSFFRGFSIHLFCRIEDPSIVRMIFILSPNQKLFVSEPSYWKLCFKYSFFSF